MNLEQVGFAKFLAARTMRESIGAKETEIQSLTASAEEMEAKSKQLAHDILQEFNTQLIEQLSEKQTASFDECLSKDGKDDYLKQRLFPDNSTALTIQNEASRRGTVAALCGGSLGRFLELSDEDSQRLFEIGVELNDGLPERIQQAKLSLWKDSLTSLSPASQEKIMKMIGKPMVFESE